MTERVCTISCLRTSGSKSRRRGEPSREGWEVDRDKCGSWEGCLEGLPPLASQVYSEQVMSIRIFLTALFLNLFIYLWLSWVFIAIYKLSLGIVNGSYYLVVVLGLGSCGTGPLLLRGMWDLPGPWVKPASPPLWQAPNQWISREVLTATSTLCLFTW